MSDEKNQTTLILGDFHGKFQIAEEWYENILQFYSPIDIDLLIQVGDFGFWPRSANIDPWTRELDHRAVFVDGNHENHEILQSEQFHESHLGLDPYHSWKPKDWVKCVKDIWEYKSRGSIEDGILYIGGAHSIDRDLRTPGLDWFPEEDIQYKQKLQIMSNIDEYGPENVHTVISHECPAEFDVSEAIHHEGEEADSNRMFLQQVLKKVEPDHWFFGHYHQEMSGVCQGTEWRCVDMIYPEMDKNDFALVDLPT